MAEKFIKINSKLGSALRVVIRVIVLPLPGGPQIIKGQLYYNQLHNII